MTKNVGSIRTGMPPRRNWRPFAIGPARRGPRWPRPRRSTVPPMAPLSDGDVDGDPRLDPIALGGGLVLRAATARTTSSASSPCR